MVLSAINGLASGIKMALSRTDSRSYTASTAAMAAVEDSKPWR